MDSDWGWFINTEQITRIPRSRNIIYHKYRHANNLAPIIENTPSNCSNINSLKNIKNDTILLSENKTNETQSKFKCTNNTILFSNIVFDFSKLYFKKISNFLFKND